MPDASPRAQPASAISETSISDIAEAGWALGEASGIDAGNLALVGVGYGGGTADSRSPAQHLLGGGRPSIPSPSGPWGLGECPPSWRNWVANRYRGPSTQAEDRYAPPHPVHVRGC